MESAMTFEELKQRWDEEERWMKKHYIQAFFIKIWEFLYWRLPQVIKDTWFRLKQAKMRAVKGYDNLWLWGHCDQHAHHAIIALEWLKTNKHGVPITFCKKGESLEKSQKRWNATLDKMIAGFKAFFEQDEIQSLDIKIHSKEWERLEKIRMEGMGLYVKHYRSLWD